MNNKVIIMWGFIIFGLVISVYIIGISNSQEEDYTEFKENIKLSLDNYLSDYDKWPGEDGILIIDIEELSKNRYINSLEYNKRLCEGTVTVSRTNNKYNYEYDIKCIKEIKE